MNSIFGRKIMSAHLWETIQTDVMQFLRTRVTRTSSALFRTLFHYPLIPSLSPEPC